MTIPFEDNKQFVESVIDINDLLENILGYSIDWIRNNYSPEDIFEIDTLEQWAEDNGYRKFDGNF